MRTLAGLLGGLAVRAGADPRIADAGTGPHPFDATTADRAGQLGPGPQDGVEPGVGRWLGCEWWLWLALAVVLAMLSRGYVLRRWRKDKGVLPEWLTRRARR